MVPVAAVSGRGKARYNPSTSQEFLRKTRLLIVGTPFDETVGINNMLNDCSVEGLSAIDQNVWGAS